MMFAKFFARHPVDDRPDRLYAQIVAQSRSIVFYLDMGVPDTAEGRLEVLLAHQILLFHRLDGLGGDGKTLAQATFDLFLADMDESMREMGIGDLTVPKKMKAITGAFYGRGQAYMEALEAGDMAGLKRAVARNMIGQPLDETRPDEETDRQAGCLAAYVASAARALEAEDAARLLGGTVTWPDPNDGAAAAAAPDA